MFKLLRRSQKLLDVLGDLFGLQNDIFCAGQRRIWLSCISTILPLHSALLLTVTAHAVLTHRENMLIKQPTIKNS